MWQSQWQQMPAFLKLIDWPNWLAIVGTASAVSAIVVLLMQALRNRIVRRRERRDTALDIAISLEEYARLCRAMMHRADWARSEMTRPDGRDAAQRVMLPAFLFPEKIHWTRLGHKAVSELRDFPARIHAGREDLSAFSEYRDPAALCDEVGLESAKAARDALALARDARKKHGCVPWRPGARDADLNRDLLTFISSAEAKRDTHRDHQTLSFPAKHATPLAVAANERRIALD